MKGTHAILQVHCPVCIGRFLVGDHLVMKVVEQGFNAVTGNPCGVMIEYLHERCLDRCDHPEKNCGATWRDDSFVCFTCRRVIKGR